MLMRAKANKDVCSAVILVVLCLVIQDAMSHVLLHAKMGARAIVQTDVQIHARMDVKGVA